MGQIIRNQWFLAVAITILLGPILFFPRSPLEILIVLVGGLVLGLLFASIHRGLRRLCRHIFPSASPTSCRMLEMMLGLSLNPFAGGALIIIVSLALGLILGVASGASAFEETTAGLNSSPRQGGQAEPGATPLLLLPAVLQGGRAGLSVIGGGLIAAILGGVAGIIFAAIYPWLPLLVKPAPEEENS